VRLALKDRDLVAEGEDLHVLGRSLIGNSRNIASASATPR
jgi:hypothetical protein